MQPHTHEEVLPWNRTWLVAGAAVWTLELWQESAMCVALRIGTSVGVFGFLLLDCTLLSNVASLVAFGVSSAHRRPHYN